MLAAGIEAPGRARLAYPQNWDICSQGDDKDVFFSVGQTDARDFG